MSAEKQTSTTKAIEEQHGIVGPPSAASTLTSFLLSKKERAAIDNFRTRYLSKQPSTTMDPGSISALHTLPLPLALPQISPDATSPIIRAYSPNLSGIISQSEFLAILDAYNLATCPSPGLQALEAAAGILGLVPEPHVQIAGQIAELVAESAQEEMARARGEALLRRINAEVLSGKAVKVEVVRGKDLGAVLGLEKGVGLPVADALSNEEDNERVEDYGDAVVRAAHASESTNAQRRVCALGELILPVTFDVPPPAEQTKKYQRFLAKEQKKSFEKYQREQEKKRMKRREKEKQQSEKAEVRIQRFEDEIARLEGEKNEKLERIHAKAEERIAKGGKDREKVNKEMEKDMRRVREECTRRVERVQKEMDDARGALGKERLKDGERGVEKERKKMEKLNWLVVRNA